MGSSGAKTSNWVTGAWVTNVDIGGGDGSTTGQNIVSSSGMTIPLPNVDLTDWRIEVQFTQRSISGTGNNLAWIRYDGIYEINTADNQGTANFYTRHLPAGTTAITRRIRLNPTVLHARYTLAEAIYAVVRARGENVNTVWDITGIKARLLYLPV